MKKFIKAILTIVLITSPAALLSQDSETPKKLEGKIVNKPVACFPLQEFLELSTNVAKQTPIFGGETNIGSAMAVLINTTTRTWTIIEIHKTDTDEIACLVGVGKKFNTADWQRVKFLR